MPDVIAMVKANVCRALPPQPEDCDLDKDEPLLEEAWPHLQVPDYFSVFVFCLNFIFSVTHVSFRLLRTDGVVDGWYFFL